MGDSRLNLVQVTTKLQGVKQSNDPFLWGLTRSGWLTKLGGKGMLKNWKRRWCVLKEDTIAYYKTQNEEIAAGTIPLRQYTTVRKSRLGKEQGPGFEISSVRDPEVRCFSMYADNEDEQRAWVSLLKTCLKDTEIDVSNPERAGLLSLLGGTTLSKSWVTKYTILKDEYLYFFKDETQQVPSDWIDLVGCNKVTPVPEPRSGKEFTFEVTCEALRGITFFMSSNSEQDYNEWFTSIDSAIRKYHHSLPIEINTHLSDSNTWSDESSEEYTTLVGGLNKDLGVNGVWMRLTSNDHPDFRIVNVDANIFLTIWKDIIVAHDSLHGSEQWRVSGWGKAVAVSPSTKNIAVSNKKRKFTILDSHLGGVAPSPYPITTPEWLYSLAWLDGGKYILGTSIDHLYVIECVTGKILKIWGKVRENKGVRELLEMKQIKSPDFQDADSFSISSVVPLGSHDLVAATDTRKNEIWIFDPVKGIILHTISFPSPQTLSLTSDNAILVVASDELIGLIRLVPPQTMKKKRSGPKKASLTPTPTHSFYQPRAPSSDADEEIEESYIDLLASAISGLPIRKIVLPGKKGVLVEANNTQNDENGENKELNGSGTTTTEKVTLKWIPLPKLSPDKNYILLNDRSGILTVLFAQSGAIARKFDRHLMGGIGVHDQQWVNDDNIIAITNDGNLHKIDLQLDALVYSSPDPIA